MWLVETKAVHYSLTLRLMIANGDWVSQGPICWALIIRGHSSGAWKLQVYRLTAQAQRTRMWRNCPDPRYMPLTLRHPRIHFPVSHSVKCVIIQT